ncbi:hypothetical protein H8959_020938 [Pygathrix nigripes]
MTGRKASGGTPCALRKGAPIITLGKNWTERLTTGDSVGRSPLSQQPRDTRGTALAVVPSIGLGMKGESGSATGSGGDNEPSWIKLSPAAPKAKRGGQGRTQRGVEGAGRGGTELGGRPGAQPAAPPPRRKAGAGRREREEAEGGGGRRAESSRLRRRPTLGLRAGARTARASAPRPRTHLRRRAEPDRPGGCGVSLRRAPSGRSGKEGCSALGRAREATETCPSQSCSLGATRPFPGVGAPRIERPRGAVRPSRQPQCWARAIPPREPSALGFAGL